MSPATRAAKAATAPAPATPGAPPAAPGLAVWTAATPAPPTAKRKPAVIIGAAVAAIALVGGGFALANVVKGDPEPAAAPVPAVITVPNDTPVATPTPTVPGPTTPPTAAPPVTDPPPATEPDPGTDTVEVAAGVLVPVLPGWSVDTDDDGLVIVAGDGAIVRVLVGDAGADTPADALVASVVSELITQELADVATSDISVDPPPTASVLSAASVRYEGTLATAQGSAPVEGVVFAFVRQDGLAVTMETLNLAGDSDAWTRDYSAILAGILSTF